MRSTSDFLPHLSFIVNQEHEGQRLDKFLAIKAQDLSRTRLQDLIQTGFVQINGVAMNDVALKVKEGQKIQINIPPVVEAAPVPQKIPLDIFYEDEDLIVLNKPAGLVVHSDGRTEEPTLVDWILKNYPKLKGVGDPIPSELNATRYTLNTSDLRPGIVHRNTAHMRELALLTVGLHEHFV